MVQPDRLSALSRSITGLGAVPELPQVLPSLRAGLVDLRGAA